MTMLKRLFGKFFWRHQWIDLPTAKRRKCSVCGRWQKLSRQLIGEEIAEVWMTTDKGDKRKHWRWQ